MAEIHGGMSLFITLTQQHQLLSSENRQSGSVTWDTRSPAADAFQFITPWKYCIDSKQFLAWAGMKHIIVKTESWVDIQSLTVW